MNLRLATLQRLAIVSLVGLAIAYFGLLRPLAKRVVAEDVPMAKLMEHLAKATEEAGLPPGIGFGALSNRLRSLRLSSEEFAAAVRESLPRLRPPPELKGRLEEPFQLVEFLNESQRRVEELQAAAQAGKVALTPGLARGFPSYRPELASPELLWVQLAMVNRTVLTAIRAGVREVREVSVEPLPIQDVADYGPAVPPQMQPGAPSADRWPNVRLHMTVVGTMDAVGRLMVALALTPEELKPSGLPEGLGGRPALFIDHVLIRRNELQAAEQVQVELVVGTVVLEGEP
ncbi:MAG: hypothetical protein JNL97_09030 [Verrucomicrobiales bacterium]|nr:hypothetical protein [Verrucomicrobiales bacterium]